ncbi:MAG: rhodanese-like domain-containing protein [Marivirga sp.]|nr:rhodanese-like domain-containing protein [Marivirga sp.]
MEKKISVITCVLSCLVCVAAFGQTDFDKKLKSLYKNTVPLIHAEELAKKINGNDKIILLDTRSLEEFQVSHLPHALFLDYDKFNSKSVIPVDKNAAIVVYCSVGYRSERIGEKLLKMGYKNVSNLYGGIFDWVGNGQTVVNKSEVATDSVHTYNKDWSRWLNKGVKVY